MASKSTRKKVAFNFEQRKMENPNNLENSNSRQIIEIEKTRNPEIRKNRNLKIEKCRNPEIDEIQKSRNS